MTEAAVMSWLDLNTPILPHRKFLSVYNSENVIMSLVCH